MRKFRGCSRLLLRRALLLPFPGRRHSIGRHWIGAAGRGTRGGESIQMINDSSVLPISVRGSSSILFAAMSLVWISCNNSCRGEGNKRLQELIIDALRTPTRRPSAAIFVRRYASGGRGLVGSIAGMHLHADLCGVGKDLRKTFGCGPEADLGHGL